MEPRLLIVTPTLGRSRWLAETIAAISGLEEPSLFRIVGPESVALRARFANAFIREPAQCSSMYEALNAAAREQCESGWSQFTYINDDDRLGPDFGRAVEMFAGSGAGMSYGRVRVINEAGLSLGWFPVSKRPRLNLHFLACDIMPFQQPGMLYRREVFEGLGGFDESYRCSADTELVLRHLLSRGDSCYFPLHVADFRIRAGQISTSRPEMRGERLRLVERARSAVGYNPAYRWLFRLMNWEVYAGRLRRGYLSNRTLFVKSK